MSFWGGRKQQQQASPNPGSVSPTPSVSARHPVGFESVIGGSATLKGDFKSQGNVRLDGTFEGTLEIDGNVLVGETGKITADINAKNVSIAGAVRGNVSGKKVEILRTGRVWGDITATAISTEEGCFIEGKITMITHDAAQTFDHTTFAPPEVPAPDNEAETATSIERAEEEAAEAAAEAPDTDQAVAPDETAAGDAEESDSDE